MDESIERPFVVEKLDKVGLAYVLSRISGSVSLDKHLLGRMLGVSFYEESSGQGQARSDGQESYSGFLTNLYELMTAQNQDPENMKAEIMKKTQRPGFSLFLRNAKQAASDTGQAGLEKYDIPRLFAVQFQGFSLSGSDIAHLVSELPRNISSEDLRVRVKHFYMSELQAIIL